MVVQQDETASTETKVDLAEAAVRSSIQRIKDTDTSYADGGVFEASKFAKGDGWKDR